VKQPAMKGSQWAGPSRIRRARLGRHTHLAADRWRGTRMKVSSHSTSMVLNGGTIQYFAVGVPRYIPQPPRRCWSLERVGKKAGTITTPFDMIVLNQQTGRGHPRCFEGVVKSSLSRPCTSHQR
jgi:hypothetical protein